VGSAAVQAEVRPLLAAATPIARLAAFSEIVEQKVFDAWRARRGWPVRLRGTGMAVQRAVLETACDRLSTRTEDLELTVLLGSWGASIRPARCGFVLDPKPPDLPGAARQRARWLQGQAEVIRRHPGAILRLALRGPAGLSLLASLFLRPKALVLPLKALAAALAWALAAAAGSTPGWALAVLATLWIGYDLAGLAWGLRLVPDAGDTLRALAACPAYLALWLRSLVLSAVSRDPWLSSRSSAPQRPGLWSEDGS
jgi:cellulose synthase/poly-beta-1,6-N-acetylglucosamine synthase-like glycosyltransferase